MNWKTVITAFGGLVMVTAFTGSANAGCGFEPQHEKKATFKTAAFRLVDNDQDKIVGMWKVKFLVGTDVFDFGYSQWHGDGTEILNSGSRAPATENFCLGVWAKTGHNTYKLNHFALSYNAATGLMDAMVNIREFVTLDQSGDSYTGTFTIDVYPPGGTVAVDHVAGTITGTRITAD